MPKRLVLFMSLAALAASSALAVDPAIKKQLEKLDPALGQLIDATPPWIEDVLKR